ncbi:hypothetical protein CDAR_187751 [Caerostris darwini]|uniref:Uncharacterized protein n=1 Tax=Caerostris darwini TaxID=1538125 RepID=A0AAV4R9S9_9ARAC|nr:hypothetical protein CDAR_187751 [Caerostris darwini]
MKDAYVEKFQVQFEQNCDEECSLVILRRNGVLRNKINSQLLNYNKYQTKRAFANNGIQATVLCENLSERNFAKSPLSAEEALFQLISAWRSTTI